MKAVTSRPISGLLLSRVRVVLALALLVGCGSDVLSGRAFSPPGAGNQTFLTWHAVAAGGGMNCALVNVAAAMCWGSGTLGDGRTTESDLPVRVTGGIPFQALANAGGYVCGLSSGTAYCWGNNLKGSLGIGSPENRSTPALVKTDIVFRNLSAFLHTCGVSEDDGGYCWGRNEHGELGIASSDPADSLRLVPAAVAGGLHFRSIEAGFLNTCALTTDGEPYCWGEKWGPMPTPVPTTLSFESISMGGGTTCGLTAAGEVHCWGLNDEGQFGNGEWEDWRLGIHHPTPVQVVTERRFTAVSVGGPHVCGIDLETEGVYCWGNDLGGQLGDGTPSSGEDEERKLFPTRVDLSRRVAGISVDGIASCAVTTGFEAYCWGVNTGNPSNPVSDVPVRVGG